MKNAVRMSSEGRRAAIISAAGRVFVEKGFHRTTTRELAQAAGVSEALLFKHFPDKVALYGAIQESCFKEEGAKLAERLESLEPSTSALVFLVHDLISHVLGGRPDDGEHLFLRLVLRSLMDEGEFTRLAIQGAPSQWVKKVAECVHAAHQAGDMVGRPVHPGLAGWMVHQLVSGIMIHMLPRPAVVDYGVPHDELVSQAVRFCLRGMGLREEAIQRGPASLTACTP